MTEHEAMKYAVYNVIGVGKENATTRKEIAERSGCKDRRVRSYIQELRSENYNIVTDDDGKGYYIPTNTPEGRAATAYWKARQLSRADAIVKSTAGASNFLSGGVDGQMELFRDQEGLTG